MIFRPDRPSPLPLQSLPMIKRGRALRNAMQIAVFISVRTTGPGIWQYMPRSRFGLFQLSNWVSSNTDEDSNNEVSMRTTLCSSLISLGVLTPLPALAYPIDCLILLCMPSGFSVTECAPAKAEVVRRVTPWPIEPPLQVWNCPMSKATDMRHETVRGYPSIAAVMPPRVDQLIHRVATENGVADIDISGPEFDFIRSIRVIDIDWLAYNRDKENGDSYCRKPRTRLRMGLYDEQGSFSWRNISVGEAQIDSLVWLGFTTRSDGACTHAGHFRGVGIDWRGLNNRHAYEVVKY